MIELNNQNNLYNFLEDGTILPTTPISEDAWYSVISSQLENYMKMNYGQNEMIDILYDGIPVSDTQKRNYIKSMVYAHLLANEYKYENLYNSCVLEWNPLYNVDGTETLTYTRTNTGTVENEGTTSSENSGTDTTTSQDSATTYDSDTDFDTTKDVNTTQHGLTIEGTSGNTTTNNLTEGYSETKVRQGNIGVTKTTELLEDYRKYVDYSFIDVVAHDLVNLICTRVTYL